MQHQRFLAMVPGGCTSRQWWCGMAAVAALAVLGSGCVYPKTEVTRTIVDTQVSKGWRPGSVEVSARSDGRVVHLQATNKGHCTEVSIDVEETTTELKAEVKVGSGGLKANDPVAAVALMVAVPFAVTSALVTGLMVAADAGKTTTAKLPPRLRERPCSRPLARVPLRVQLPTGRVLELSLIHISEPTRLC